MVDAMASTRLGRGGYGGAEYSSDCPYDQSNEKAKKKERSDENQQDPARTAHSRDIAADCGIGVALNPASENGHIAFNSDLMFQSNAAAEGRGIAIDLAIVLNHDAPAEGRHVASDMPAHADAAAEAGCVSRFFVGADADVASNLGAIMIALGPCCARTNAQEHACGKQQDLGDSGWHEECLLRRSGSKQDYGTGGNNNLLFRTANSL
jgi:hypothetical protein